MDNLGLYALGFLGQGLFGARLIIQWWQSERKKEVTSPTIFWKLSLGGSFIFLIYGLLQFDPVIIIGQTLSYFIYIRNLQLKKAWISIHAFLRNLLLSLPPLTFAIFLMSAETQSFSPDITLLLHPIMIVGTIGQLALNLRFVYQWYYSERLKESSLPFAFWSMSTWASVLVIIYALYHPVKEVEPVLLVSQSLGIIVYIRNMMLSRK